KKDRSLYKVCFAVVQGLIHWVLLQAPNLLLCKHVVYMLPGYRLSFAHQRLSTTTMEQLLHLSLLLSALLLLSSHLYTGLLKIPNLGQHNEFPSDSYSRDEGIM